MYVLMDGWMDVYMYAYVHKYVCISKVDIPEYNLLSMYSVKCMYVSCLPFWHWKINFCALP